ncbi:UPF0669 protein C6orf120 homolog [Planococcus citri]|uniref:UPF0669 protein C6orf120 homolog n=1 Tax=Planococcus citri TaxID=170843 RepID=UPI0031FA1C92
MNYIFPMRSFLFLYGIVVWMISTTISCVLFERIEVDVVWPMFKGHVEGGSVAVFKLYYPQSLDIRLSSEWGDADLYISNSKSHQLPLYEPNSYILHSATCGVDTVHVHERLKRPLYVSVYGHPSYKVSVYELSIINRPSTQADDNDFQLLDYRTDIPLHPDYTSTEGELR